AEEMSERVLVRQFATNHHDVGFQVNCSSGNGYRLTGEQRYQEALENGAKSLATRFSPIVGCTRSWSGKPWNYPVIIDNMMNLELLCVGAVLSEDRETLDMAISHADRSMKELYRADYSCFHVADFNPETGDLIKAVTHQGYADSSAWARGQAWGLYGYTMLYRFTNDKRYLDQAQNVAHFLIDHPNMPEDMVPYWDFDAPNIPEASRDASAAAIMASALVELSTFVDSASSKKFYDVAEKQVLSLSKAPYRSAKVGDNCGFILTNSVGFMAKNSEVDTPLTYADYYFVEAMMRIKKLATGERIGESYSCDCE
ncbi:MAG: glycosyl hydrolase family 88, partial [Rikenellaceae bacterium]